MALPTDATDGRDGLMDGTGPAALGTRRPGRMLGVPGPVRARLQGNRVEGCRIGGADRGTCARGGRCGGSPGARGSLECCAALPAAVFIPGRWPRLFVAGRGSCS